MMENQPPKQIAGPSRELAVPPPPVTPAWPAAYSTEFPPEESASAVPLSHYLWIVKRHRWKIFAFVVMCVASTIIISSRLTPIYESVNIVDVDRQTPMGVIGQDAMRPLLYDTDQFLATQIKLIQSDSVLRPVVRKYGLVNYEAAVQKARESHRGNPEDAPITLKNLKVSRPPNTYILQIAYRSPDPQLAANVANAIAQSYLEHTYNIRFRASAGLSAFMEKQLEELKARMEKSSSALVAFEKELNVINPEEKTSIITSRLLQLNTEYTNAQAERIRKEAAANSIKTGSLEAAQVSTQGEALRKLTDQVDEAQAKLAQVKATYGPNHPEYRKAQIQLSEAQRLFDKAKQSVFQRVGVEYQEAVNRESILRRALTETKNEFDRLNARSFEYRALKEEADADKVFYEELIKKIKEAGINASFQGSSIRLADMARPAFNPVFPDIRLNAILALLFSTLLGIGAAVASDVLDSTIRDPEVVARTLNAETVGSLPRIKAWHGRAVPMLPSGAAENGAAKKADKGHHVTRYEEAVRTLRDSILLSDLERRPRSLLVTSAIPGEGKTTTAVHLALAHASQARRTLLIDADLRRPAIHRRLALNNTQGLANVIGDGVDWKSVVVKSVGYADLDVLPSGPASRRVADRLGHALGPILQEAASLYDLVILDSPPVLGFAEPLQIATLVDGVVVLTVAGQTDRKAVASALGTLRRLRVNVIGLILNEVHGNISDGYYYYYYGYYNKYQRYYSRPDKSNS
jgi:succinoglycan biosynthesis transport protein ExoP